MAQAETKELMSTAARVFVAPRRAKPFYARHPWVFAGAILRVENAPKDGDVVELLSHTGSFIARGLWNAQSKIRVRLYDWRPEGDLDADFFRDRLRSAVRLRHDLGLMSPEGACRVVCSEGDGLSGLTVDRYGAYLAVQFTSLGMAQRRDLLAGLLVELLQPKAIMLRTEKGIGSSEGISLQDGPLFGELPKEPILLSENGLRLLVNLTEGQKTGYYLDQRENRMAVAKLFQNRRVLDTFCYTGGFGLAAAKAGASEVIGVDGSEPALTLARENARLNELTNITFHKADIFDDLGQRVERGEQFGAVILDPPKFAHKRNSIEDALKGYRRLLSLGIRLVESEGYLVMCCCTGLIEMSQLEEVMSQVATNAKRPMQLLERRGPGADHPVVISCPESHYLKCFVARC
jgi:23S rRNA (cytosine1962-C5)-methyltransferase